MSNGIFTVAAGAVAAAAAVAAVALDDKRRKTLNRFSTDCAHTKSPLNALRTPKKTKTTEKQRTPYTSHSSHRRCLSHRIVVGCKQYTLK